MIFVSGANGQFAHAVLESLLTQVPAASLVVGTRNTDSAYARQLAERGVLVRASDFMRPASLREALQGVRKALFIPTYDTNDVRLHQNLNAIEAAREVGVEHVVYASFLRAELPTVEHSRLVHLPTEQAIRSSGLGFTILRHALYADILIGDLAQTLATGVLRRPSAAASVATAETAGTGAPSAKQRPADVRLRPATAIRAVRPTRPKRQQRR